MYKSTGQIVKAFQLTLIEFNTHIISRHKGNKRTETRIINHLYKASHVGPSYRLARCSPITPTVSFGVGRTNSINYNVPKEGLWGL